MIWLFAIVTITFVEASECVVLKCDGHLENELFQKVLLQGELQLQATIRPLCRYYWHNVEICSGSGTCCPDNNTYAAVYTFSVNSMVIVYTKRQHENHYVLKTLIDFGFNNGE